MKKRIVVVGAGFGGVYTFKRLHALFHKKDVELVLVNPENYFLFTPLLHEVATGGIFPENIIEPIRKVVGCCLADFYPTTVERIETESKTLKTPMGDIAYDYLVLCPGSETNFFNTPGAEEYCHTLKSLEDAITLKHRFIDMFELAMKENDREKRKAMLHFVVVGGGPTGVELAAEMAEFFHDAFAKFFNCDDMMDDVKVTIVQRGAELIPQFSSHMRKKSAQTLQKKHVDVLLNTGVVKVEEDGVQLDSGEHLKADTVIWSAGVKPVEIPMDVDVLRDRGRLVVDKFLQLQGHKHVFALGDAASFTPSGDERALPALAQVATAQGTALANNIAADIEGKDMQGFVYKHKGNLVSLGQWAAIAEIGKFHFFGHFTWWVWRTIYLSKLLSWTKKFQVGLDWTIDLFTPRDISRF